MNQDGLPNASRPHEDDRTFDFQGLHQWQEQAEVSSGSQPLERCAHSTAGPPRVLGLNSAEQIGTCDFPHPAKLHGTSARVNRLTLIE
jgi:hypothetical protein